MTSFGGKRGGRKRLTAEDIVRRAVAHTRAHHGRDKQREGAPAPKHEADDERSPPEDQ